ncbi:MAG: DUF1499 domain-containing protein [Pseudohongiella sp.]|jgi:uncharacterized protein (DUF1499 family)|nr:DUF1499 domain-containing protein [Pseudohongiella sp.]
MNIKIEDRRKSKITFSLKLASGLIFIAGLGLGLLTLASAAGIWLGLWDFRRGFTLLGTANDYGDLIALACLGLTLCVSLASQLFKIDHAGKLVGMAAAGTLIAAVAYYIPESFRPPEGVNYPPIHDISTDTLSPPKFIAILPLRADAANTVVYGGSTNMTAEKLAQATREAYPDLVTQRYNATRAETFAKALAAVQQLGWELVAAVPEEGRIEATDTTLWFRFKDDIVIKIEQQGNQSIVNARSVSRVGTGDVGANAIRLRAFFALL